MKDQIVDVSEPVALIGGAQLGPEHLNILQSFAEIFVAADGGVDQLRDTGLIPLAILGDLDSISAKSRQEFAPHLVKITEEDTTDLEKAVTRISAPVILGAGFLGGRLDHSFASMSVLARFSDAPLILLWEAECCFRCPDAGLTLTLPVGTPIAVLPMDAINCTSSGLRWDMQDLALHPAGFVSSSNVTVTERVTIRVSGPALITLPVAQLAGAIAAVRAE